MNIVGLVLCALCAALPVAATFAEQDSAGDHPHTAPSPALFLPMNVVAQNQSAQSVTPALPLVLDGKFIHPKSDGNDIIEFMGSNFCFNDLGCSPYKRYGTIILVVFPAIFFDSPLEHKIQIDGDTLMINHSGVNGTYYREGSPELQQAIADRDEDAADKDKCKKLEEGFKKMLPSLYRGLLEEQKHPLLDETSRHIEMSILMASNEGCNCTIQPPYHASCETYRIRFHDHPHLYLRAQ